MGDSGFVFPLSLLALLAVAIGIVAFVIACRVRSRAVRGIAGVLLLGDEDTKTIGSERGGRRMRDGETEPATAQCGLCRP